MVADYSHLASLAAGLATLATLLHTTAQLPGQAGYAVEVVAQTDANLTNIDLQTAINDAGWITFVGVEGGLNRVFAIDPTNVQQVVATGAVGATYTGAAINNTTPPAVAFRNLIAGPFTYVHRSTVGGSQVLVGRSPNNFDSAASFLDVNDAGVVTFAGLTQSSSRLVLFAGSQQPPTTLSGFAFALAFRPEITDAGRVLIRAPFGDITVFAPMATPEVIASATTWALTGTMPGIARDGQAVGFIGNRGLGKALYLAVRDSAAWRLFPVVGENGAGFSDFGDTQRVGLTSKGDASTEQRVTLVYYAQAQGTLGAWGIYATDVVISTVAGQLSIVVSRPSRIAQIGDPIGGQAITRLSLGHPINRDADVTFWFATASGSGVARARRKVRVDRENMRLKSASVTLAGQDHWHMTLEMDNDNANDGLQPMYKWRRWWHCEVEVFNPPTGETLDIDVTNAGYEDTFVPAWSLSVDGGQTYQPYGRIPASRISRQTRNNSTHSMRLVTPPGVTHLRLAKFLPYTVRDKDAWLARLGVHPRLTISSLPLASEEGRPLHLLEITDQSVPSDGKSRIWVHSGTHPGETTSYFTVEGLVGYLLSGTPAVEGLLDKVIVDIVPMHNPDGVFRGNYRSNAHSRNLEERWLEEDARKPKEVLAVKRQIETFMGTAQAPGLAPITVLLNLHSAHDAPKPFHFEHELNPGAGPSSPKGVRREVAQLESTWVSTFRRASAFVDGSRKSEAHRSVIEGWIHDHYSIKGAWSPVMAITFEGTYGNGPNGTSPVTADDYRALGADMGRALLAYIGRGTVTDWGRACEGTVLTGSIVAGSINIRLTRAAPRSSAALILGVQRVDLPFPPPSTCSLGVQGDVMIGFNTDASGNWGLPMSLSSIFCANLQVVVLETRSPTRLVSSNGLTAFYRR